jgi:hypothetical protein
MWRRVDVVDWTDVSEDRIASIFKVEKSASKEAVCYLGWLPTDYTALYIEYRILNSRCENFTYYDHTFVCFDPIISSTKNRKLFNCFQSRQFDSSGVRVMYWISVNKCFSYHHIINNGIPDRQTCWKERKMTHFFVTLHFITMTPFPRAFVARNIDLHGTVPTQPRNSAITRYDAPQSLVKKKPYVHLFLLSVLFRLYVQ